MGQDSTKEKEVFVFPTSFAQQRLWFIDQLEPNSSVYNIRSRLRLKGPLGVTELEQSFNEIVRRHEALRTTFSTVEGEPVQVISPSLILPLTVLDLGDCPESEREDVARRLAREDARRPFDLARGPLVRMSLLRLGQEDHILLLTMHHIVSDGGSMGVFFRELSDLYKAFSHGKPSPLAELPIQYADYAVWQRQWLQGEVLEGQLSYWKKQLEGIPGVLNLPTDRPRPGMQSFRGKRQSIELSRELTKGLKALSRREGVTLFMTLLAAFQTLLYRYTGQQDIVVGSPIANRNRTEIERLIGFFVNTLVLRSNFSGNPTFKQLLAQVREMALGAYAHQDLPFEKLVEELQPERSLSHSPLFQVMFVLQNAPAGHQELSGLTSSRMKLENDTTKFDLSVSLSEQSNGIKGLLEYSTDLFDEATIIRMSGHFQKLLEAIVANPDQCVSDLPLLTEPEKRQLLLDWNDTKRDYPRDKCIHRLFEEQVNRTPDAVAVVFEDKQLTYRELNGQANQLARYLVKQGVGPETLVGICVERSLEMVVGLLGILKAGGAYVPLDPCFPKERLAFMCEDSQASLLLSQERLFETLPAFTGKVVCLDRDWEQISRQSNNNPDSGVIAENLAYVIYTSGSTGKPKGVEIQHGGLVNLVTWHQQVYSVTSADRATQLASPAFDASVWELWPYLAAGASVDIPDVETVALPSKLPVWLGTRAVTICFLPTALAEAVSEEPWPPDLALRVLLTGGDKLHRRSRKSLPFFLANNYGPTENTVVTTWTAVATDTESEVSPSIGRPIANTEIYLLNSRLDPVPIGVAGEIYIGGVGLARGYLKHSDLTAEKFIPNPFSVEPGARLYKTGDLARYLPDGNVEFLGRIDHQVKLRGFRIELGEIEAVLSQHPAVRETAVLAREEVENPKSKTGTEPSRSIENLTSDKRLVAYVVPSHGAAPTTLELRAFLKDKLPDYMVPSAFVFLDAMPLTPNGKLDLKALRAPDQNNAGSAQGYVAPRTPVEELIAEIWAEVLKLDNLGIHDNFFDLGGHSLKATQVISRLREALRLDLSLRVLFETPTVAELASRVEQTIAEASELEELARNMAEVEALSEEEIERQLERKTPG